MIPKFVETEGEVESGVGTEPAPVFQRFISDSVDGESCVLNEIENVALTVLGRVEAFEAESGTSKVS